MSKKYKAAVIGVGKAGGGGPKGGGHAIGYVHAEMFQSDPRVELLAGADINADNLKAFQAKFNVPGGFASYQAMLAELKYGVGTVPLVPYAQPGSRALAELAAESLRSYDVVLLQYHGAVTVGPSLMVAHQRMESLEHAACILLAARQVKGRANR